MEYKREMRRKWLPSDADSSESTEIKKSKNASSTEDYKMDIVEQNASITEDYKIDIVEQDLKSVLVIPSPGPDNNNNASNSLQSTGSRRLQASFPSLNLSYEPEVPSGFNRCGKVISMHLENFMCHESFTVEFGPNINFLVGKNGSGKSAVITALILGLGGNARATNRAASIAKLIKNGENAAKIEITLCNAGFNPFEAEHMGAHVTVVRRIRQSSSTYELKDARGRIVSKKLDDVKRMLRRFQIHVDNPIFVLNQEASREFLKKLTPKSNFTLLMRATHLDICDNALTECLVHRQKLQRELEHLKLKKQVSEELVFAEEEKLATLIDKEAVKLKLKGANCKLAWLSVGRKEEELANCERHIHKIEAQKAKLQPATTQKDTIQAALTQQLITLEEKMWHIRNVHKAHETKMREAVSMRMSTILKAGNISTKMKNAEKRLSEEKHEYEYYNVDYAKIKQNREEHAARAVELKELVAKREDLVKQLRKEQLVTREKMNSVREQVNAQRIDRNKMLQSTLKIQSELDTLGRNRANPLYIYGEQAINVHHALRAMYSGLDQYRMPRGPLGQYISVSNPKYRDLVESQLGAHRLRSYIVNSHKECQSLRVLLQKFYGSNAPNIVTTAFTARVYNVSRFKVRPTTPDTTVLIDEISCDDPVVMNYLIDSMRIETVLVTESKETAEFLTSDTKNVPPNLTGVLVPSLGLEYTPSPEYAAHSIRIGPGQYVQVNVDLRIRQLKDEQCSLQERAASIQADYMTQTQMLERRAQEVAKITSEIDQYLAEVQKATLEILEIGSTEYREDDPQDHRLKINILACWKRMEKCKGERYVLQMKLEELDELKGQCEAKISDELKALEEITEEMESLDTEAHKVSNQKHILENEFSQKVLNLQKMDVMLQKQLTVRHDILKELATARQAANLMGEFIKTEEDTEEKLLDAIGQYESKIRIVEQLNYDPQEVAESLGALRLALDEDSKRLKLTEDVFESLCNGYKVWSLVLKISRNHWITMVQSNFERALEERHFSANFGLDVEAKTWTINVFPDSGNRTANARSLSGGERSFTTVSLLKGLWTISDHPFYFLDEYDVFTDKVNSKSIADMLINEGLDRKTRQYCFLTPLDTEVEESPYIRVHKLSSSED